MDTKEVSVKEKKYLSILEVWALSFGASVGWGAFFMPGNTFLKLSGPLGSLLGMVIGAIIMIIIGRNYHYMISRYDSSGGAFTYTRKTLGEDHGFLCAWFLIITYISIIWANATAVILFARYLFGPIFQFGFHYAIAGYDIYFGELLLSSLITILSFLSCLFKKKIASIIQLIFSSLLFIGILTLFFLVLFGRPVETNITPLFSTDKNYFFQIFRIVALMPWAFVGYESISHSTDEFKFDKKKTFSIIIVAVIVIIISYILLTILSVLVYPTAFNSWHEYIFALSTLSGNEALPVFYAVETSAGKIGLVILGIAIISGIITGIIGNLICSSRLIYSMAKDDFIPKWFKVTNKEGIPKNAILFILVVSLAIPFFGRTAISWIVDISTLGASIAYFYISFSTFINAKKDKNKPYMATGLIGLILSISLLLFLMIPNISSESGIASESYFIISAWGILGLLFFRILLSKNKDEADRFGNTSVVWVTFMLLIFLTLTLWNYHSVHKITESSAERIQELYLNEDELRMTMTDDEWFKYESSFISDRNSDINRVVVTNTITQLVLTFISIILMFSIYTLISKNEKTAQIEKIKAEEKSMAKSAFLFNMSHDIRTPMNSIIGYLEMAQKDNVPIEKIKEYLGIIDKSSKYMLSLLDDILEMSRIENGKIELNYEAASIDSIVDGVTKVFSLQMAKKDIEFKVDALDIKDRFVMVDIKALNRILYNLISNAYKFSNLQGKVTLIIKELESYDTSAKYMFTVKDNGIGMKEEFVSKIFEPFERETSSTESKREGTGLGMAITKNLIDLMKGEINVKTELGKGTEISFTLNLELSNKDSVQHNNYVDENISIEGINVLLVEDVEINRAIATLLLETLNVNVEVAVDGLDALNKIKESTNNKYDIILMDVQMPNMNGYDATKAIRNIDSPYAKSVPIIAVTANVFEEDIKRAIDSGMNDHLAKPINLDELANVIRKNLKKEV